MADKKNELALVPIADYAILAESPENMRAIVQDNLGNGTLSPFDLEQIKVPTGGATLWDRGDEPAKEVQGIVVYFRDMRSWWEQSFDEKQGANSPPDCQSQDGVH